MITGAAVCPHPPLLFRELTGEQDPVAELRAACRSVVGALLAGGPDLVVVVGGAEETRTWDAGLAPDVRPFGTTAPAQRSGLPLSLGVGARLLAEAGWSGAVQPVSVAWDAAAGDIDPVADEVASREDRVALLVLGDGSARRGAKAPGYLDERAFPFDEATGRALAGADPQALLDTDAALARELMAGGRAAFQVMARAVAKQGVPLRGSLAYRDDPFGVMYFVALWQA